MDGTKLVKKIDIVLKENGLKRQALAIAAGVTPQAISDWSKNGGMPGSHIALKIADFLSVSIEWLLRDDYDSTISNFYDTETGETIKLSPHELMKRVEDHVMFKSDRNHLNTEEEIYESILDIISMDEIRAFRSDRAVPDFTQLYKLATRLGISIDWLLIGKSDKNHKSEDNPIYYLSNKYESHLTNFHCLHKSDQNIVEAFTAKLFESRRKIRDQIKNAGYDPAKIPEVWQ